ncbi:MAG: hypothetical protein KBD39_04010 [Sterolibacterium sp.]|nr:hypothetical protein [Sterolibacterium sp.]MBP9799261.1 hypothetical protein [Sterolibacterium sp.]
MPNECDFGYNVQYAQCKLLLPLGFSRSGSYGSPMRVIAKSTPRKFWERPDHADAQGPLENWHDEAAEGSPEADEMEVLVALVESYENKHYPIGPADPVEAIKFRMEQQGLAPKDLEPYIRSSGRVSEVLNRKRALSLRMVKRLHDGLRIPYESLLSRAV